MKESRIPVTKCPKCKAICVIGSDEDGQVFCARCRTSFKCEHEASISVTEYRRCRKIADKHFEVSGWEAFIL